MLVDFENTGYISVCPTPDIIPIEEKNTYIPASTWGFIKGDISEQKDLMNLLTTIESGLTAEQIALLVNADDKLDELQTAIAELEQKNLADMTEINAALDTKADADAVYTKEEVDNLFENIEVNADLTGYATEDWVKQQGYITEHQSLADYYNKSEVDNLFENIEVDVVLTGYATEEWVKQQGYITEHQSLDGYATESWVKQQNYLTEHQSLADYYTKNEVDTAIENIEVNVDLSNYYTKGEVNSKLSNKLDTNKIWTGTQDEWDALTATQQNSYIIAMIEV